MNTTHERMTLRDRLILAVFVAGAVVVGFGSACLVGWLIDACGLRQPLLAALLYVGGYMVFGFAAVKLGRWIDGWEQGR